MKGQVVVSGLSGQNLLSELLKTALDTFQATTGTIAILELYQSKFSIIASVGLLPSRLKTNPFIPKDSGISGYVFQNREIVIIDDNHVPPISLKYLRKRNHCAICLPLIGESGQAIGIFSINKGEGIFEEDKIPFLKLIAKEIAIIIEEIRLKLEREKTIETLKAVSEIFQSINCTMSRKQTYQKILEVVVTTTQARKAAIFKPSLRYTPTLAEYNWNLPEPPEAVKNFLIQICTQSVKEKKLNLIQLSNQDNDLLKKFFKVKEPAYLLVHPLICFNKVYGVLVALIPFPLDEISRLALDIAINLSSATLQNTYLFSENRELAIKQERLNLARELHDGLTQDLIGLKMQIEYLKEDHSPLLDKMEFLERWEKILNQCVEDSRKILTNLRKNVDTNHSFEEFLREKINSYFPFGELKYFLKTNVEERLIPLRLRKVIFQIIQESVVNVCKHSQASTLKIKIGQYRNLLYIIIKDNGKGFDQNKFSPETKKGRSSYGILGIKERASLNGGEARITSSPGKGTTIKVGLPFHGRKKPSRSQ